MSKQKIIKKSSKEEENPELFFVGVDPFRFCTKKLYEIAFLTQTNNGELNLLNSLVEEGKKYENTSLVKFVTYDEVVNLLKTPPNKFDSVNLPSFLKPVLQNLINQGNDVDDELISSDLLAKAIKLKLLNVMYEQYVKEVKKQQRRKALEEELNSLCVASAKPVAKNKDIKDKKGAKSSIKFEPTIEDYTKIPLELNSVLLDVDIYNQMNYYVFVGFVDADVFEILINHLNVPITALLEFNPDEEEVNLCLDDEFNDEPEIFWIKVKENFHGFRRVEYFEDSVLMKFCVTQPRPYDMRSIVKEFINLLKSFCDVKLLHMNYLKNLKVYELTEFYKKEPLQCSRIYREFVDQFPPELINYQIVLHGIILEVTRRFETPNEFKKRDHIVPVIKKSSQQFHLEHELHGKSSSSILCSCPFSINAFFEHKKQIFEEQKKGNVNKFIIPKYDFLRKVSLSYGEIGSLYTRINLKYLEVFVRKYIFNKMPFDEYKDIIHKHDVSNEKTEKQNEEQINYFIYLYMFSALRCSHGEEFKSAEQLESNKYFQTYNTDEETKMRQASVFEDRTESEILVREHDKKDYSYSPNLINYHWTEKMDKCLLLQKLSLSSKAYMFMDTMYCHETDTVLVQFHDALSEFGLHYDICNQSLRTPICLRDFCRYIKVHDADWLDKNKPPEYSKSMDMEDMELCKGAAIIKENKMFAEYEQLFEDVLDKKTTSNVNFEERLDELLNYPKKQQVKDYANKFKDGQLNAFDLGPSYIALTGRKTVFQSHDDVQVIVDNVKFEHDEPSCCISIKSRGQRLVFYSNQSLMQGDYNFHFSLMDGTIITFTLKSPANYHAPSSKTVPEEAEEVVQEEEKQFSTDNETVKDIPEKEIYIPTVDREFLTTAVVQETTNTELLAILKKAVDENRPIYKINKSYRYVKPKVNAEIPLSAIVNRLMSQTIKKRKCNNFNLRYVGKVKEEHKRADVDFRITFPSGLYVTLYSPTKRSEIEKIKQKYCVKGPQVAAIENEVYRIFSKSGNVLYKTNDGTITILNFTGTITTFEKPSLKNGSPNSSCMKPCVCKDMNMYRKQIQKIFKDELGVKSNSYVSRRHLFTTKKSRLLAKHIKLIDKYKVPYEKTTVINSLGVRTTLQNGKLKQCHKYYVTKEIDYVNNDAYFERTDGTKTLNFDNGEAQTKFPDNTKITSWFEVSPEDVDDFVFVSIGFKFEHPYYTTIVFKPDNTFDIPLCNDIVLSKKCNDQHIIDDGKITFEINPEKVFFTKMCQSCKTACMGKIYLHAFIDKAWQPMELFLKVVDSYGKIFSCTFDGHYRQNSGFTPGSFNLANCCHAIHMEYKKLYAIKRNLSGEMLWSNYMLSTKVDKYKTDDCSVLEYASSSGKEIMDFRRNIYKDYKEYFLNTGILNEQFVLKCYKAPEEKEVMYQTYIQIYTILNEKIVYLYLKEILKFLETMKLENKCLSWQEKMLEVISTMHEDAENFDPEIFRPRNAPTVMVEFPKCRCNKQFITMDEKVEMWRKNYLHFRNLVRNKVIPDYFSSEFCTYNINK